VLWRKAWLWYLLLLPGACQHLLLYGSPFTAGGKKTFLRDIAARRRAAGVGGDALR